MKNILDQHLFSPDGSTTFFCPRYLVWSWTFPSLHLTIPQKYIDSLWWVTASCSKKEVTNFLGVLLYFPDWHSKNFCPMYPVWSLTIPSLYLTRPGLEMLTHLKREAAKLSWGPVKGGLFFRQTTSTPNRCDRNLGEFLVCWTEPSLAGRKLSMAKILKIKNNEYL